MWDYEYDLVVVGSGASGFASAITGKKEGLKTILIEKEKYFGGASALSGGGTTERGYGPKGKDSGIWGL